ncbi:MAG: biotin/lipoate A/B protein ligase family protein [Desulfobacterales bacterium]|nr:biotin/lipoate A/B protein ligase family protein [Desulfobacterales bacterium]
MRYIDFGSTNNPALNLALEEHLYLDLAADGPMLLCYVNTGAVVIGRNQLPWSEVSAGRLARERLPLVRRVSGGGAVYHDPGNLNFSLLLQTDAAGRPGAATILQPVVAALRSLGLPARLSERHAVFVDRYKVSGTAQYMTAGKTMTHGTLLVDAELDRLERCLEPDPVLGINSRGRPSVHSPVANLSRLRPGLTRDDLVGALRRAFADVYGPATREAPRSEDLAAARRLAAAKYRTWRWNVGRSPQCTLEREGSCQGELCRFRLHAVRGVIRTVEVDGPGRRRGQWQRWASQWLVGRRLGAGLPGVESHAVGGFLAESGARDFYRWLERRLPGPLPLP